MKPNVLLAGASTLSILLFTFHLTDDIVHGWEPGTLPNLYALPIFVVLRIQVRLRASKHESRKNETRQLQRVEAGCVDRHAHLGGTVSIAVIFIVRMRD